VGEEEVVCSGEFFVVDFIGRDAVFDCQGTAHEHGGSVAYEAGDDVVVEVGAAHVLERGVDGVAEVTGGIDERAIQVEDDEFDFFGGDGAEDEHAASVAGSMRGIGNRE
jgi:hypothetical protein